MKDEQRGQLIEIVRENLPPCTCLDGNGIVCIACFYKKPIAEAILEWHEKEISECVKEALGDAIEEFEARIEPLRKVWEKDYDNNLRFEFAHTYPQMAKAIKSTIGEGNDAKAAL